MEIVLLLVVILVSASALYVAVTLNARTMRNIERGIGPLVNNALKQISGEINKAHAEINTVFTDRIRELRSDLAHDRERTERARETDRDQLEQTAHLVSQRMAELISQGRKTDRDQLEQTAHLVSERMAELISAVKLQAIERLDQIADQVTDVSSRLVNSVSVTSEAAAAATRSGESAATPPGEASMAEVTDPEDPLARAALEAESNRARNGWGQPPQLYALAAKAEVAVDDPELDARIRTAPEGSLIPIKQKPLPAGNPLEVLAGIHWPDCVVGCVLVTELVVLPPEAENEAPPGPGIVEQQASDRPGGQSARLAVGVSREGRYTCVIRLPGDDFVQIDPQLADDLVTALLGTF
jgi:hypothetical protein